MFRMFCLRRLAPLALVLGSALTLLPGSLVAEPVAAPPAAEVSLPGAPVTAEQRAQRVQEASGTNGVVVAAHPEASEAGIAVLQAGGNAVDAAVAVSLALGVAEPYGSGMGGKFIMVYYRASDQTLHAVDGMGQAGHSIDIERYRRMSPEERNSGGQGVAIPGLPAAVDLAHREFGRLPWEQVVQPAIDLAERGFRIEPKTVVFMNAQIAKLRANRELGRLYYPNGRLPEVGSRLANPELAGLMRVFQRERSAGFYQGEVAATLVNGIQAAGGFLTLEDFAKYEAILTTPVVARLGRWRIAAGPPPTTGGSLVLTTYAALLPYWDRTQPLRSVDNLDRLGRVVQQTYPAIQRRVGDSPGSRAALREFLSPSFIENLRTRALNANVRNPYANGRLGWAPPLPVPSDMLDDFFPAVAPELAAIPFPGPDEQEVSTTHFVVADAEGNMVSVTQSQSHHFGGGLVVPGTGLVLNNDMSNFGYNTPGVNYIQPGKRPRSTTTPTIVLQGDQAVYALGVPGAQRIPIAVLQAVLDLTIFGADSAEVIASPRFHVRRAETSAGPHNVFQVERDFPADVKRGLEREGWQVEIPRNPEYFGGLTIIHRQPDGTLRGVADLRRTNWAAAY